MSQASKERCRGEESKKQGSSTHINKALSGHSNDQQLQHMQHRLQEMEGLRQRAPDHHLEEAWQAQQWLFNPNRKATSITGATASGRQTLIQITDLFTDTAVWTVVAFHST